MNGTVQNGIYYKRNQKIGNSFCIVFLRANSGSSAEELGKTLSSLWSNIQNLQSGKVKDLDVNPSKNSTGNLSALIGYNFNVFSLDNVKRKRPKDFKDQWNFCKPSSSGGGPILSNSKVCFDKVITENPIANDHVVIQFIADTESHTHRALLETWKELKKESKKNNRPANLRLSNYYTGFHGINGRNLMGFHDGISNIKSEDRLKSIAIKPSDSFEEYWTVNGTYMSFIRIRFDLKVWESLDVEKQEIIIGRDKETGCPIIGIDNLGKPIKDPMCPVKGTYEVTDPGNECFRDYSSVRKRNIQSMNAQILQESHITASNPFRSDLGNDSSKARVFRQGFQFIEPEIFLQDTKIGLNFICFQDSIEKLKNILTYESGIAGKNTHPSREGFSRFEDFFSVTCAASFFIPPLIQDETFPGSTIFLNKSDNLYRREARKLSY